MCVCVSVMIICAYMYVSTSYIGYVTPSLSDDPLFVASGPDAALSWIDWNCCICISTSKKDMRCLQCSRYALGRWSRSKGYHDMAVLLGEGVRS